MCESGQMFELLELKRERKNGMVLQNAKDCMEPLNYEYVAKNDEKVKRIQKRIRES